MLDTIMNMAADKAQDEEELVEKYRNEIHCETQAFGEAKSGRHCFNVQRRWSKKKKETAEVIVGCSFRREIEAETEVTEIQGEKSQNGKLMRRTRHCHKAQDGFL